MRSVFAAGILLLTTVTSVFARDLEALALPEPDTMFLMGVAGAGLLLALRKKNKKDK